ncbi:MAG TPA: hypothetical protein VGG61_16685, partial [Gemmataceae bacterium]
LADCGYNSGSLVAKDPWCGMGTGGDLFQVSTTHTTRVYSDQHLAWPDRRHRHRFQAHVIHAAVNGGLHCGWNRL